LCKPFLVKAATIKFHSNLSKALAKSIFSMKALFFQEERAKE
jgi:hypothetical protein